MGLKRYEEKTERMDGTRAFRPLSRLKRYEEKTEQERARYWTSFLCSPKRYEGDWCSYVAPSGYTILNENDTIVLQKVVAPDLWMQITACRAKDLDRSDHTLKDVLKWRADRVEKEIQSSGHAGERAGAAIDMMDGLYGRTAHNSRIYNYPYVDIFGYAWNENNDVVVLSICWFGSQIPSKDMRYLTEPLGIAYQTFRCYD